MIGNRGVIGKFKQNTDFGGRLGSQEAYLLSAGGFYPRFVAAASSTPSISDSSHTVLLAKASGNDGVNTSINDASDNDHSITVNGDAVAQAFTPYHPGGYSTSFDGNGDYLTVPTSADFEFGDGDWTIEFWHYPLTIDTSSIIDYRSSGNQPVPIIWLSGNGFYYLYVNGGNVIQGSNNSIVPDRWYHVAVSRVSGSTRMFVNGEQVGSTYSDSNTYEQGGTFNIGRRYSNAGTGWFYLDGYLRDLRVIKGGTGLYSTAFAPPSEPLTVIDSNTKLLLFGGLPYPKDKSASDRAITQAGDVYKERIGPYDYLGYGNTSHGGSVYFDGSGDYLEAADSADFQFGSGDFTIEAWIYLESASNNHTMIVTRWNTSGGSDQSWLFYVDTSTMKLNFSYRDSNGSTYRNNQDTGVAISLNQWHHVAVAREGSNFRYLVNGQLSSTVSDSNTVNNGSTALRVGQYTAGGTVRNYDGYISDLRIVKGTAVYTSAFTPPTSALTAISDSGYDTSLLTCNEKPNIYDASKGNRVTLGGTAKSSTAQKKNASSSMLFNGNSYVELVDNHQYAPGTNNFVVEFWMRYTGGSGTRNIIDTRGQANGYAIRLDSSNNLTIYSEPNGVTIHTSASALTQDQWYHVAFVRNNKESYLFIDGAQSGSSAASYSGGNPRDFTSKSMVIGAQHGKSTQYFSGYVEDIRIGNNISRYPFIPTAETLTSGSLTKALACYAASETTAVYGASSTSLSVTKTGNAAASDFGPADGMKSVYFDGSGDYLTIDLGVAIGTNDFCVEGWAWRHPSAGNVNSRGVFSIADNTSSGGSGFSTELDNISLQYRNNSFGNEWAAFLNNGQRNITDSDTEFRHWYHFVVQRNGGTSKVFIDGSMIYSIADTYDYANKRLLAIGAYHSGNYWYGYISNLRVSVGSGSNFYSNSFTPPTSELTS